MRDKEKTFEGFGNRTFDEWTGTLTDDELRCLERHLAVTFGFRDGSELVVSLANERTVLTGGETMAADAWGKMEKCRVSVLGDWLADLMDRIAESEDKEGSQQNVQQTDKRHNP